MIHLIYGGSGSGKSEYAEKIAVELNRRQTGKSKNTLFYLATMKPYGKDGEFRVMRHRKLRQGKGFITIERSENIEIAAEKIEELAGKVLSVKATVLLECVSNLVANEMFGNQKGDDFQNLDPGKDLEIAQKIMAGIDVLKSRMANLVIVSNNIFEAGVEYEPSTLRYMESLGKINRHLAQISDQVTEIVVGIPVRLK